MSKSAWNDTYYVRSFELARAGHSDSQIAEALGVTYQTFKSWVSKRPALKDALTRGRTSVDSNTLQEYIFNRLTPQLQHLWQQITLCDSHPNGVARLEALLSNAGKEARQSLFLYALVNCSYNPSEACRRVNISRQTLNSWVKTEPRFAELMDEVTWHKGNYFESTLYDMVVREHDPACTIFANKTFNRKRGYGDQQKIKVEGEVTQNHQIQDTSNLVDLEKLNLPLDTLITIYEAQKRLENEQEQGQGQIPTTATVLGLPFSGQEQQVPG